MEKLSHNICILLTAFVSVAVLAELANAALCCEPLDSCDENCSMTCTAKHPGGKGTCDYRVPGMAICKCLYECAAPPVPPTPSTPTKKCNVGLGRCSFKCNEQCCESKCASSYRNGDGYCDSSLGYYSTLCQCKYDC